MHYQWTHEQIKVALKIQDCPVFSGTNFVIDSREVKAGAVFIGLRGGNSDGGVHYQEALRNGASLCIVNNDLNINHDKVLSVLDTEAALVAISRFRRQNFPHHSKVIAITGSVGKTSTKELVKLGLNSFGNAYATVGNLNNHLGLPISIINAPDNFEYCILEMGMNHVGEIDYLAAIAKPDIGVITNIAAAHLEFFNSVEDIAHAKSEVFNSINKNGWAVLNIDDHFFQIMRKAARAHNLNVITFGMQNNADVQLLEYDIFNNKTIVKALCCGEIVEYFFPVIIGKHLAFNSLIALAIGKILGCPLVQVASGLALFQPICGRGAAQTLKDDIILIDESYNANSASMKAGIQSLSNYRTDNNRLIAILGDMKELGRESTAMHEDLAKSANSLDLVYTVGDEMKALFNVLDIKKRAAHTSTAIEMSELIVNEIQPNDIILVKGSFSMNMSNVVQAILQKFGQ